MLVQSRLQELAIVGSVGAWCGRSVEELTLPNLSDTGIDGFESAARQIATQFANDGWRVDV
jgi:hypothetical protein